MSARDDFSAATKRALAERAGHRCSFPGCRARTIGPSDESAESVSSSGMACHIAAAAGGPGARRYDPDMTAEERCSIYNGIWMCYRHGKLIDTDETRFSPEMLRGWRAIAERLARFEHELGTPRELETEFLSGCKLIDNALELATLASENESIGNAIQDSCLPVIWGDDLAHAVRDVAIEIARNAFIHGGARRFRMTITGHTVRLADDGAEFDAWSLGRRAAGSGGVDSVRHLSDRYDDRLVFGTSWRDGQNEVTISLVHSRQDVLDATPCNVEVTLSENRTFNVVPHVHESCRSIYFLLPKFMTISDTYRLPQVIAEYRNDPRTLVFVVEHASWSVQDSLRRSFPQARLVVLDG
jgi:hypothetical protein